jgi:hypothetical protein
MGALGIHRWGLAFPCAVASNDGLTANPYPRTILLKAIGTFVAQVALEDPQVTLGDAFCTMSSLKY